MQLLQNSPKPLDSDFQKELLISLTANGANSANRANSAAPHYSHMKKQKEVLGYSYKTYTCYIKGLFFFPSLNLLCPDLLVITVLPLT